MKKARLVLAAVVTCCLARSSQCRAAAYAYVANRGDNTVSAIRGSDNTITEIRVDDRFSGSSFMGVSIAPDGDYVYVANAKQEGIVYMIDTSRVTETSHDVVVAGVAVGIKPIGVAVSPEGAYVYVANRNSDTVYVIDASDAIDNPDNAVVKTVFVDPRPVGVAVTPNGEYVYVTGLGDGTGEDTEDDTGHGTVSVIRTSDYSVTSITLITDENERASFGQFIASISSP